MNAYVGLSRFKFHAGFEVRLRRMSEDRERPDRREIENNEQTREALGRDTDGEDRRSTITLRRDRVHNSDDQRYEILYNSTAS